MPDFSRDADNHPGVRSHKHPCPPILMPNEEGKNKILLNDCHCDCVTSMNNWIKVLKARGDPPGIVLPASVCPPHWKQRKTVVHAIQTAAKDQGDMMLPVDSSKEGETHICMHCHRGIVNIKCWKNTRDKPELDACRVQDQAHKTDVKMDTFVNKSKNTRLGFLKSTIT